MKRYCNILRDNQGSKETLKRLEKQHICQDGNAASSYSTHCESSSFISSTSTVLSWSEVEESYDSFRNPERFINKFGKTYDSDQVEYVNENLFPENEYESKGEYFDSQNDILYKNGDIKFSSKLLKRKISQSFSESC